MQPRAIEAQTWLISYPHLRLTLAIIPVINKIDLPVLILRSQAGSGRCPIGLSRDECISCLPKEGIGTQEFRESN